MLPNQVLLIPNFISLHYCLNVHSSMINHGLVPLVGCFQKSKGRQPTFSATSIPKYLSFNTRKLSIWQRNVLYFNLSKTWNLKLICQMPVRCLCATPYHAFCCLLSSLKCSRVALNLLICAKLCQSLFMKIKKYVFCCQANNGTTILISCLLHTRSRNNAQQIHSECRHRHG